MRRTARMFATPLPLSLFALLLLCGVCTARTASADPNYDGTFDRADCNVIVGWAADTHRLNIPIQVSIYVDSTLLTTVLANVLRASGSFGCSESEVDLKKQRRPPVYVPIERCDRKSGGARKSSRRHRIAHRSATAR